MARALLKPRSGNPEKVRLHTYHNTAVAFVPSTAYRRETFLAVTSLHFLSVPLVGSSVGGGVTHSAEGRVARYLSYVRTNRDQSMVAFVLLDKRLLALPQLKNDSTAVGQIRRTAMLLAVG